MKQLAVILLTALLLTGCSENGDGSYIEETGTLETTDVVLSSQTSGEVMNVLKSDGDKVVKGDTIYIIDSESLRYQLMQAEANHEAAAAALQLLIKGTRSEDLNQSGELLKQAKINFKQAKADFVRYESLYSEKVITKKQFEDAENRLKLTRSALNAAKANNKKMVKIARPEEITRAKANVKSAEAAVSLLNKQIDLSYITSPINGNVVETFVEAGEVVVPLTFVVKVTDLSKVELTVYVSEVNVGKVKLGQKAEIFTDTFPDKAYPGKVTYIANEAEFTPKNIQTKDERTKLVFAVKIEADNPDYEMKSGIPADAKIYIK